MVVYVDDVVHLWRDQCWAHLLGDMLDEFHAMVVWLGIPRRVFQNKLSGVYYDVFVSLCFEVIVLGVIAIFCYIDRTLFKVLIVNV